MSDGPAVIPDRLVDVVATRIAVQRQRRTWPFPRRTTMTTQIKLIAGLAAAVVVAVGVDSLRPGGSIFGGQTPAPTRTVVPAVALPEGTLEAGRYRIDLPFIDAGLSVAADIPAGWTGHAEFAAISSPDGTDAGLVLTFLTADGLFSDPCHWDLDGTGATGQPGDVVVGPTVADLVTALKANTSYGSSTPVPVTIGGHQGQELELQLPGDDVLTTCDEHGPSSPFDGPAYFVFSHPDGTWYAQGPNSRWHLYILDVEGTRLITLLSILERTSQAEIAAAEAIVESLEITP